MTSRSQVSVVIVGAGVAGLSTARHLVQAGFTKVTVLEGSHRVGGRIMTVTPKEGEGVVELGATCIHGASPENPVFALAQEWGLADSCTTVNRIAGQYYQEDGSVIDHKLVEKVWTLYKEVEGKIEERVNPTSPPGERASSTMSCQQYLENARAEILENFPDPVQREQASRVYNSLLNYARFMSGYELTKISADLQGSYREFPGREAMFTGKGYDAFVENLWKTSTPEDSDANVLFNRIVFKIVWAGPGVNGSGATASLPSKPRPKAEAGKAKVLCTNGEVYEADHVVVTCALGHLKANYGHMFEPPLPEDKAGAIERMGFGRVTKLFVHYDKPFWKEGVKLAWSKDVQEIKDKPDWVRRIVGFDEQPCNPHILGGPFGGQGSEIMDTLTDEEVAKDCSDILSKFLGDPNVPAPDMVLRSTWNTDPLFLGSYSYCSTENRSGDIENLVRPLPENDHPVLLFAGEATHPHYFSTVHGAYLSGVRESNRIIQLYAAS